MIRLKEPQDQPVEMYTWLAQFCVLIMLGCRLLLTDRMEQDYTCGLRTTPVHPGASGK